MNRRVVVTGMGLLTPLGRGLEINWKKILKTESNISTIKYFDITNYPSKIAAQIPFGENEGEFNPDTVVSPKERRHIDPFILYGICSGIDTLTHSRYIAETQEDQERSGMMIGSGSAGLQFISEAATLLDKEVPRRLSPFVIPATLTNLIGGHLSIKYKFKGPNLGAVTACATGTHALGESYYMIKDGRVDVMLAGGAEAGVCPVSVGGFGQAKALCFKYNDDPQHASRPFDKDRDGFVIGEGAGTLLLEEYEHAKKRGATIYAEVIGYAATADAYHITAPGGGGAIRCMKQALATANLSPESVDYINTHGTSTPTGDLIELKSIKEVFGTRESLAISSTKGTTGHLLGAAGAVEAIYSILALQNNIVPPTANLENPVEEASGLNLVAKTPQSRNLKIALSNSFGFGGTNGCIIFKKVEE